MPSEDKKQLCRGCRNDYYNQPGNSTTGECWMLATAEIVQRTSVGYYQSPPYAWRPETTLSCHRRPCYAWIERDDVRIKTKKEPVSP